MGSATACPAKPWRSGVPVAVRRVSRRISQSGTVRVTQSNGPSNNAARLANETFARTRETLLRHSFAGYVGAMATESGGQVARRDGLGSPFHP